MERRTFIKASGLAAAGGVLINPSSAFGVNPTANKLKIALVGTGIRGTGFWGKPVVEQYADIVEFVGLCDINPGRLALAKQYMGVACSTYTDFDTMMKESQAGTAYRYYC